MSAIPDWARNRDPGQISALTQMGGTERNLVGVDLHSAGNQALTHLFATIEAVSPGETAPAERQPERTHEQNVEAASTFWKAVGKGLIDQVKGMIQQLSVAAFTQVLPGGSALLPLLQQLLSPSDQPQKSFSDAARELLDEIVRLVPVIGPIYAISADAKLADTELGYGFAAQERGDSVAAREHFTRGGEAYAKVIVDGIMIGLTFAEGAAPAKTAPKGGVSAELAETEAAPKGVAGTGVAETPTGPPSQPVGAQVEVPPVEQKTVPASGAASEQQPLAPPPSPGPAPAEPALTTTADGKGPAQASAGAGPQPEAQGPAVSQQAAAPQGGSQTSAAGVWEGESVFGDLSKELDVEKPGTVKYSSVAETAKGAKAAGWKKPSFQTYSTAGKVRKLVLGAISKGWEALHITPQAVYRELRAQGRNVSEGRALTINMPKEANTALDAPWKAKWNAAKRAGQEIRAGQVYGWVRDAIRSVDEKIIDADTKAALELRLNREFFSELGLSPDDVIVKAKPPPPPTPPP